MGLPNSDLIPARRQAAVPPASARPDRRRTGLELTRLAIVLSLLLGPLAFSEAANDSATQLHAKLVLKTALGTESPYLQLIEARLEPSLQLRLARNLQFHAAARLRADQADQLAPGQPSQPEISQFSQAWLLGDDGEVVLREFNLRARLGNSYLTVGKQQIVWGNSDGLKVLDLVNPQDFREFILDEFGDSRTPLWSANLEVPVGPLLLQAVWLPDTTYHQIPEEGALFEFTASTIVPKAPPGLLVEIEEPLRPKRFFKDSDIGLRVSTDRGDWDLALLYLYHYDDIPIPLRQLEIKENRLVTVATPGYRRSHLIGASYARGIGNLTLRGEASYAVDRYWGTNYSTDRDGVVPSDELAHVIGLDWFGLESTLLSVQIFQNYLLNHDDRMIRHDLVTRATFLARRTMLNETLVLQLFWIQDTTLADGLLRPELRYQFTESLEVRLHSDLLYGTKRGLFGEFDNNDRSVIELHATF